MRGRLDHTSQDVRIMRDWALGRIESARNRLESPALSDSDTAHQRGRLAALREFLRQCEPPEPAPTTDVDYAT